MALPVLDIGLDRNSKMPCNVSPLMLSPFVLLGLAPVLLLLLLLVGFPRRWMMTRKIVLVPKMGQSWHGTEANLSSYLGGQRLSNHCHYQPCLLRKHLVTCYRHSSIWWGVDLTSNRTDGQRVEERGIRNAFPQTS